MKFYMVYNILGEKFVRLYARRIGSIMDILFIIIIAGLSFITGAISITVFKSFNQVNTNETEEISKKLQKSDLELKEYQQAVSEHFLVLSQLVTNVINGYKDINEHLTKSALRLSSPEIGKQLLKNNNTKLADLEAVHQKIDLSNRASRTAISASLILKNQAVPVGSSFTRLGVSTSASFTATISPSYIAEISLAVLTLSMTTISSPRLTSVPGSGNWTKTTSPNC